MGRAIKNSGGAHIPKKVNETGNYTEKNLASCSLA